MGKQEKNTISVELSRCYQHDILMSTKPPSSFYSDEFTNDTFQAKLLITELVFSILTSGHTTSVWCSSFL